MQNLIKRLIKSITRRISIRTTRKYKIGSYSIVLPPNHMLDIYQANYKNYDKKLPVIGRLIKNKFKEITIIDIGANIGDTAAALMDSCSCPIICIEGNTKFLHYLRLNLASISGCVRIIPKFIGPESAAQAQNIITKNGTAHILREKVDSNSLAEKVNMGEIIPIITYREVIAENIDLPKVRLVKIDTDGYDFQIILGSINQLAVDLPVVFFEFDPSFSPKHNSNEALKAVNALISVGYVHFVIYDNFGNYIFSFSNEITKRFIDLFTFLRQSNIFGGGVSYLDVCCLSARDEDIFSEIIKLEIINI